MSSTTTHITIAERTTHSHAGSLYLLPRDEEERQRLLAQHRLYTRLFSGRLVFPLISLQDGDQVLDVGTGAGAWLTDAHAHLPESVQLYGVDVEPRLFPPSPSLSKNVHLAVCSGTALPRAWSSKFALVHQRLLICAYTRSEWAQSLDEAFRVLRPGGYAQLVEIGPEWVSGPRTARHVLFLDAFLGSVGMLMRCGVYLADMMKAAGFVDVTSEEVSMNLGEWAGEDGVRGKDMLIGAWRGMRDSVMRAGGFGRFASADEFDGEMDEVSGEWDNIRGSHAAVRVFCGRKPTVGDD